MSTNIDPTTVRLSNNIMLSDLMGCSSVYRRGITNRMTDSAEDTEKLREAYHLAETMDAVIQLVGPVSFTYGYISPHLSRQIVTYQDATRPSYHRWDAGAALDFRIYGEYEHCVPKAPIDIARAVEQAGIPYSRMITYSESPVICFGTKVKEKLREPRRALYENRYVEGERKPTYLSYPQSRERRIDLLNLSVAAVSKKGWVGQGHPSYHLHGVRQLEHEQTSQYTVLSDFLYHARAVNGGKRHRGGIEVDYDMLRTICAAGSAVDTLVREIKQPISILRAISPYKEDAWSGGVFDFEFVPPQGVPLDDAADTILRTQHVDRVQVLTKRSGAKRILVEGSIDG